MDEHKPQEQAPEKVPARRKAAECAAGRRVSCLCDRYSGDCTGHVADLRRQFGGSSNYKLALKFALRQQVVDKRLYGDADDTAISDAVERDHQRHR